jgi:hypothetical protein
VKAVPLQVTYASLSLDPMDTVSLGVHPQTYVRDGVAVRLYVHEAHGLNLAHTNFHRTLL